MKRFLARRLLGAIPTLLGITLVTFAAARWLPGTPLGAPAESLSVGLSGATLQALRRSRGLDQPAWEQYAGWVGRAARGDLGESQLDGQPVTAKLAQALPRTLLLSGLALLVSYLLGVPLGVLAAAHRNRPVDRLLSLGAFVLYSLPSFWVAVLLLLGLSGGRGLAWFPIQGLFSEDFAQRGALGQVADVAWHGVLPVACLSYAALAAVSRYVRGGMLEVLGQDFIRTARAKGLAEGAVVWRHALKNGALPAIQLLGVMLPAVLSGSVVVEEVFGIHGMGLLAFEAALGRDTPVVLGVTLLVAVLTLGSMLLADLTQAWLDPRIGWERR